MRRKHSLEGLEELEQRLLLRGPADAPSLGPAPRRGAPGVVYVDTNPVDAFQNGQRLRDAVNTATSNQTIVLMPGVYQLPQTLFIGQNGPVQNLTIRGWSDDYTQVQIYGRGMENPGYDTVPHGFAIYNGQNITIANLSIGDVWQHAIDIQGNLGADNIQIYHVRLYDAGEQFIKANPGGGGADNVSVEYSLFEYTNAPPTLNHGLGTGYFNGISAFEADNWLIRYNLFRNFHVPDTSDFWYNPAILMWNGSANTIVEGNTFLNVDRAIFFGLIDTAVPNHQGGYIRNNVIWQDPNLFSPARRAAADSLIGVYDSPDTKVYHNTVLTNGNHPMSVEVRWANTGVEIRNNLTDAPMGVRNGGAFTASGNYLSAIPSMFVNPAAGDVHLVVDANTQANVIDREPVLTGALRDMDGATRTVGLADIGADEITPTPLHIVTMPTVTTTGFTLQFNQVLDTSVLNLYDQGGLLGAPDLTLVGELTGPVAGTAFISNGLTRLIFVKTGGLLLPDTYTLTLRSASNGFRTTQNQYLSGNQDYGFVHTFTVAAPAANTVTVSIPDFARGPGQPVNVPSTTVGLPLVLYNPQQTRYTAFTLQYDPALLEITGFQLAPGIEATPYFSVASPGNLSLTITGTVPFTTNPTSVVLGTFTANVPATAPYGGKYYLDINTPYAFAPTGQLPALDDDAVYVAAYLGDATGNARLSSADATGILRRSVGLWSGFEGYQLLDPVVLADVDGNGRVSATDATRVLQEAIGLDRPEIPPLPANPPTIYFSGPDPLLHLPTHLRARTGDVITVPVLLDVSEGLESLDLALAYDTSRLEVVSDADIRRGNLTQDFDLFGVHLDAEAGTIRVGMGRSQGVITGRGAGSVLEITFRIRNDAPLGSAIINLMRDLGPTETQLNEGRLDLNPDPSNQAGDVLDGRIRVQRRAEGRRIRDLVFAAQREWGAAELIRSLLPESSGRKRGPAR